MKYRSLFALATWFSLSAASQPSAVADWTAMSLDPSGATHSRAEGVSGTQQGGYAEIGGLRRAGVWNGTAGSWLDLHPSETGIKESIIWNVNGAQQAGYVSWGYVSGLHKFHASLWTGTAVSWTDLDPGSGVGSCIIGIYGGKQAGFTQMVTYARAALWNGTKESYIDLHPANASESCAWGVFGDHQVGYADVAGVRRASLWSGSADTWIDLTPVGATESWGHDIWGDRQVGHATVAGKVRASLWSGTAASWIDLNPPEADQSWAYGIHGSYQVGVAYVNGAARASLWAGTAASWLDLHAFLPVSYSWSEAKSVDVSGNDISVVGCAYNVTSNHVEAVLWHYAADPVVGISCNAARDPIIAAAKDHFRFLAWGIVDVIDSSTFELDDGSGSPLRVVALDHSLSGGEYVKAMGWINHRTVPPTLVSAATGVNRLR